MNYKASSQHGAALLAFALILLAGSSYYLLRTMNEGVVRAEIGIESTQSLKRAKEALISWAVNHPVNPGTLLLPDRQETTNPNYDGDSDCFNGTIASTHLLGRLPWRDYPSPTCIDSGTVGGLKLYALDSTGEQLWYAVSKNLVYQSPDYPFISPAILNKTTDWITVRDPNGNVLSNRVAFVVISPGNALGTQDRSASAPDIGNYLDSITIGETTYSNSDYDQDFIIYPSSDRYAGANYSFNDRLVFATIDELMDGVSRRVINEIGNALSTYHNDSISTAGFGALPWLSPFKDPKADSRIVYGTHTGSNNASSLSDSKTDFSKWGVKEYDVVRNVTDGSLSLVTSVSSNTLTVTQLDLGNAGNDNDFDSGDEYYIVAMDAAKNFDETADNSSSGLTLVDDSQEFVSLDLVPGDVIDNITDGSSGIVETVSSDSTIVVSSLSGGSENDFDNNDAYRIRSYTGESTSGSSNLTLEDTTRNFTNLGVSAGDIIVNQQDGSVGRVESFTSTTITASDLQFGMQNDFDDNEIYILPRNYGVEGTTEGSLAFHRVGGHFPSGFDVDWNIPETISASANSIIAVNTPGTHTDYINNLIQFVQTSSGTSGTISVDIDKGSCVWTLQEVVECKGRHRKYDPTQGQMTSGYNTKFVIDNTKDFIALGINPGDIVQNYDDESFVTSGTATAGSTGVTLVDSGAGFDSYDPTGLYNYLIRNTSLSGKAQGILATVVDEDTLTTVDYDGWNVNPITFSPGQNYSIYTPAKTVVSTDVSPISTTNLRTNRLTSSTPDFDYLEFYRIKSATGKLTGTTTSYGGSTLYDTGQDFVAAGVQSGDVVHNVSDNSWGEISNVTTTSLTAALRNDGGSRTYFGNGESYEVYYAYMNSRAYEFIVRFSGTAVTESINGKRTRDVCLGYTDCTGTASTVALPYYSLNSSGTATSDSSGLTLEDSASNFISRFVTPGYTVVNSTDGSYGIITSLDASDELTVGELNNGSENDFDSGDSYYISAPVVTIKDYDASENELGSASVTIPSGGAQGSIRVSNIDYYLNEQSGDLPSWFVRNKWYQYLYVAYSNDEAPGDNAVCSAGSDCITVNISGASENDIRALVMITGEELSTQNTSSGMLSDYFDDAENTDGDDIFNKNTDSTTFNDLIRTAVSCPSDNTRLCWSN